jgi:hypothetical protein
MTQITPEPAAPAPHPAPAQTVAPQNNPVGLVALIVSIVALVFAIIPVISFIAWLPALAGVVLGIVGLAQKNRKKAFAGIGLGLSILAGIIAIIVSVVTALAAVGGAATAASEAIDEQIAADDAAATEIIDVTYEVTGNGPFSLSYSKWTSGSDETVSTDNVTGPWTETFQVERGGTFDFNMYMVSATAAEGTTELGCTLTIDGESVDTSTSTGDYGFVSCSGTSSSLTE